MKNTHTIETQILLGHETAQTEELPDSLRAVAKQLLAKKLFKTLTSAQKKLNKHNNKTKINAEKTDATVPTEIVDNSENEETNLSIPSDFKIFFSKEEIETFGDQNSFKVNKHIWPFLAEELVLATANRAFVDAVFLKWIRKQKDHAANAKKIIADLRKNSK